MAKGALSKVAIVMKIARLANVVRVAKTRDRVMNFNQGHFWQCKVSCATASISQIIMHLYIH